MQKNTDFQNSIEYITGKTLQGIKNLIYREFKAHNHNITPEQWAVLYYLHRHDGFFQKQVSDFLYKDKPTMTRILDILEKRNLVIRMSDEKDRRKSRIYLTQEGRETVKQLLPVFEALQVRIQKDFSSQEMEILKTLLQKVDLNVSER